MPRKATTNQQASYEAMIRNSLSKLQDLAINAMTSRQEWLRKWADPRRNYDDECGYVTTTAVDVDILKKLFERDPVARRVCEIQPLESWKIQPMVYEDEDVETETEFEKAWDNLCSMLRGRSWFRDKEDKSNPLWEYLIRADILSGIGGWGVLLLGIDDGKPLSEPVDGIESGEAYVGPEVRYAYGGAGYLYNQETLPTPPKTRRKLLFIRPFDQVNAEVVRVETDPRNSRYGLPTMYQLKMEDPTGNTVTTRTEAVHWTRCVHIVDNLTTSETSGSPRLQVVHNRLTDLMKVYGGGGEGYWRGAFPGLSIESHPQLGADVKIDPVQMRDQMENYMNGLQRYLGLGGFTAKSLAPQVVDPTPQVMLFLQAICIRIGCPMRVFLGSERGELASSQDERAWTDRMKLRQTMHVIPRIIVPVIDRLIMMGVLPEPKDGYCVHFPDLDQMNAKERSEVTKNNTESLAKYVAGGVNTVVGEKDFLTRFLHFSDKDAESILENAMPPETDDDELLGSGSLQEEDDDEESAAS